MPTPALLHHFTHRTAAPTPPRILVVDDDADWRTAHAALLRAEGYEVELARDGEQALVMLAFRPFDLLVTDWQMPRLDGASLVHWLRATESSLPVVMITGAHAASELPATIHDEVVAVLPKPAPPGKLVSLVKSILPLPSLKKSNYSIEFAFPTTN